MLACSVGLFEAPVPQNWRAVRSRSSRCAEIALRLPGASAPRTSWRALI